MSRYKEIGWTDSSSESEIDLNAMVEDMQEIVFTRAHRGLIVMYNLQKLKRSRQQWAHCLISFLLNEGSFSPRRVQTCLRITWTLQDSFHVVGTEGKSYVFHFQSQKEKEYVLANGPRAIQEALMHFADWRPNIRLSYVHVESIPVWVQIWGLR